MKNKKYFLDFKKTIYGCYIVYAKDEQEAKKKIEEGDCDEFDNKSDYEIEGEIHE